MGFARAVKTCLVKFGDGSGRANRSEYFWFGLFQILIMLVAVAIDLFILMGMSQAEVARANPTSFISFWLGMALWIPTISVTVRRLHDIDRSGFWWLLYLIPFAGIVPMIMIFLPGTPGRNSYGLQPGSAGEPSRQAQAYATLAEPSAPMMSEDDRKAALRALRVSRMTT